MKKRILSMLLVLVFVVSALSACGNRTAFDPNFVVPEGGYNGEEVTITFSHTMGANLQGVLNKYIEKFNKIYPNIKIEHTNVGGWGDINGIISKEITAGNQPNIAYCYPDHVAKYNISKSVVALENLMKSEITATDADGNKNPLGFTQAQIDDFVDAYYNEGKQYADGMMYTLPLNKSTEVLYYNKTFFAEHDLEVPTTWDEMEALCAKILTIDPKCTPLGYDSEANWFITMCEQLNSPYTSVDPENYFLFDNETNHNFVKRFREWHQKGYVTTSELLDGAYSSSIFTNTGDGNRSYMSIGSTGGASYQCPKADANGNYPFEVGITTIPQIDPEKPKVISQGPNLCIFNSENPLEVVASWLFVKYLTTDIAFQTDFSMISGYAPVLESASTDSIYADYLAGADGGANITALAVKVSIEQSDACYTSPAFNGSSTAREEVGKLMAMCMATETDDVDGLIKKAFKDAIQKCQYRAY